MTLGRLRVNGKFHNRISVGKPRTRREDVVSKDALQIPGIRGWRRDARATENKGAFWGKLGPRRSCSATHGWVEHNNIVHKTISRNKEFLCSLSYTEAGISTALQPARSEVQVSTDEKNFSLLQKYGKALGPIQSTF